MSETVSDKELLEFLLSNFQTRDVRMDGQHSYSFRNSGWPMTHCRGPNIRAAFQNVFREIEREKGEKQ